MQISSKQRRIRQEKLQDFHFLPLSHGKLPDARLGVHIQPVPAGNLLDALGNPQRAFRIVHVAGTNGKGSVCAMIEAARDILIWGRTPDWPSWTRYAGAGFTLAWFGFWWFQRTRKGFADVI